MTDAVASERIDRGQRATSALREFLDPAFDVVITDYMSRLTQIAAETPWDTGKIIKLASAAKIAEQVRVQIKSLVADGEVALDGVQRARQIEGMSTERRKWLG
jgi:hypothetical protein